MFFSFLRSLNNNISELRSTTCQSGDSIFKFDQQNRRCGSTAILASRVDGLCTNWAIFEAGDVSIRRLNVINKGQLIDKYNIQITILNK
jgi:hypothetical protein